MKLDGLVQLLSGAPHHEDAHQEGDDQLDQEDQPAGQHVLGVSQHLLHASECGPDVDVEGLGGDETNDAGYDVAMSGQRRHREDRVLKTERYRGESGQDDNLECLRSRDDGVERSDELCLCETGLDMSGQNVLRYNSSDLTTLFYSFVLLYLAENVSQSYAYGGRDHGDGHPIHQAVEVTTGQVDHYVAPDQGETDEGVERHEDDQDSVGRLEFCPQQHCVYIVSEIEALHQNVVNHRAPLSLVEIPRDTVL